MSSPLLIGFGEVFVDERSRLKTLASSSHCSNETCPGESFFSVTD
jgi:hypothetical protein